jgi:hypothetical protein
MSSAPAILVSLMIGVLIAVAITSRPTTSFGNESLVIEFDNPDNNSNHIHSVWHGRDDFAVDLLAKHYRESPH